MKDVRVQVGDNIETRLPTIGLSNFKMMCSESAAAAAAAAAAAVEDLVPVAKDGTELPGKDKGKRVMAPTSAMNMSYAKPYMADLNPDQETVDWSLSHTDPEADRVNSFIRCGSGVLELYFERPIAADSYR